MYVRETQPAHTSKNYFYGEFMGKRKEVIEQEEPEPDFGYEPDDMDEHPDQYQDVDDGFGEEPPGIDLAQYQNPFTKEDLQNVHLLRNTYYKNKLISTIKESDLYESAKRAWTDIVNDYFDQNWMLANLERRHSSWTNKTSSSGTDEVRGAWLTLKLNILKNTVAMCRSDRNSPDSIIIESGIKAHFKAVVSRAKGPQRERVLQGRQKIVQENVMRNIEERPQKERQPKERKKLW